MLHVNLAKIAFLAWITGLVIWGLTVFLGRRAHRRRIEEILGEGRRMKTFCTDYWALNEVGRLCRMGGRIEAETLADAEAIAEKTGHVIVGEFQGEVEWPEGGDFCDRVTKQRDEDWLKGTGR
ncbi:hypothetical protein LCGC14_2488530 [marine sediment metagenome]|uniref:Uncharacterized protein n=1 Tax=marine sediment metagenome TaxID=412755 RepID=A0A0F9DHC0_9ZZZZ